MSSDGEGSRQQHGRQCEEGSRVVTVAVEATGGTRVRPGDRVRRGQDLGVAPDFGGRVVCPVSGTVEACGFDPARHVFEITIVADE